MNSSVSARMCASHKKFTEMYSLKFHILSDPDSKTAEAYGVGKEKTMYEKKIMGTVRPAFVIEDGKIIHVPYNINADGSAGTVLAKPGYIRCCTTR